MKFGESGTSISYDGNGKEEKVFRYWVLPDKPMTIRTMTRFVGHPEWDRDATAKQTEQIKEYLSKTLEPGTWCETYHRFYFENEEDFEMFKTMCLIGWA